MIKPQTRTTIKGYLEGFIQGMIDEHVASGFNPNELRPLRTSSKDGDLKPFHESLLPDGILTINEFERSFSTKLGTSFEECAKLIARDIHTRGERGFEVKGRVPINAIRRIEEICNGVTSGGMRRTYTTIVNEINSIPKTGEMENRSRVADLYIKKTDGTEIFIEIKSPKPNKGQCVEILDRLLQIHAIKNGCGNPVKTYYAMAYNPYGINKSEYRHSFALNYMDINNQVLIGKEFWDLVGGTGTYEEILGIYQEVGREKGPDMIDQLALRY